MERRRESFAVKIGWTRKFPWQPAGQGHDGGADGHPRALFIPACQTDDATGVTRCPKLDQGPVPGVPLHTCLSQSVTALSPPSSLFLLHHFPLLLYLLTLSQRSVGHIHRPGEEKSAAAKEKPEISVSLGELSGCRAGF